MSAPDLSVGYSEFGEELARLCRASPGAKGAVLCDTHGDAIDLVYDAAWITAVDVELCGAQIAQAMFCLDERLRQLGVAPMVYVLEGERGHLLAGVLQGQQLVTLALRRHASIGRAMHALEGSIDRLLELLR